MCISGICGHILTVLNDLFQNATSDNTGIQLSAVQSARYEHTCSQSYPGHHFRLTAPIMQSLHNGSC